MVKNKEDKKGLKKKIAVVRVRGRIHIREDIKSTLKLLNLNRINHCVIIEDTPQNSGMVNKVKDYVTWGEIDVETLTKMLEKRGRLPGNRRLDEGYMKKTAYKSIKKFADDFMESNADIKSTDIKPVFRLRPPKKGYERSGVKKPFSVGGALGYRREEINNLLKRMI